MTDAPPKPKRRRWRWLVVGMLPLILAWWYWPRGDARFVGRWKNRDGDVMVLNANESGHIRLEGGGVVYFSWLLESERLTIGRRSSGSSWKTTLEKEVASLLIDGLGLSFLAEEKFFQVANVAPNWLDLAIDSQGDPLHGVHTRYRRLPE